MLFVIARSIQQLGLPSLSFNMGSSQTLAAMNGILTPTTTVICIYIYVCVWVCIYIYIIINPFRSVDWAIAAASFSNPHLAQRSRHHAVSPCAIQQPEPKPPPEMGRKSTSAGESPCILRASNIYSLYRTYMYTIMCIYI